MGLPVPLLLPRVGGGPEHHAVENPQNGYPQAVRLVYLATRVSSIGSSHFPRQVWSWA